MFNANECGIFPISEPKTVVLELFSSFIFSSFILLFITLIVYERCQYPAFKAFEPNEEETAFSLSSLDKIISTYKILYINIYICTLFDLLLSCTLYFFYLHSLSCFHLYIHHLLNQKRSLVIYQPMLESWAMEIIRNVTGCKIGDKIKSKVKQKEFKQATRALLPVLRPDSMQSVEDQTLGPF